MALPRILIVQTGSAGPLVETHGDFPHWFQRALDGAADATPVLRAHLGEELGDEVFRRTGAQGVIVTGSPLSMTAPQEWMERLGEELLRQGHKGVPVLGVCFGHQLLCHAAGAKVVKNPRGTEAGTVQVQLTEAGRKDPLFAWARGAEGGRIEVQATHSDAVWPVPQGASLLASNENTPVQAVRLSETVASVQFHPELWPEALRTLIRNEAGELRAEGLDAEKLAHAVRETPEAAILKAFAEVVAQS